MKPLPIRAASGFSQVAPDVPNSLRDLVREVCPKAPRRLNRLAELGLIGAHRCVGTGAVASDTAIVMAVTTGCLDDSVRLLRAVAHRRPAMPMDFINVSSNMTGFHLAASLGVHGSNQVIASNDFPWQSAVEVAMLGGPRALIGAVEECSWPIDEQRQRLTLPSDSAIAETSQWLWADQDEASPIATIHWHRRLDDEAALNEFLTGQALPVGTVIDHDPGQTPSAYSGFTSAAACVRAILDRTPSFLYLQRGHRGQWSALHLTCA